MLKFCRFRPNIANREASQHRASSGITGLTRLTKYGGNRGLSSLFWGDQSSLTPLIRALILVLLTLPLMAACASGPSKSELDAEVRRLCAIDGGIKVYETVTLPPDKFNKHGVMRLRHKEYIKPEDEYYLEWNNHYYRQGNPEISRSHARVIRRNDGKVMGESIRYLRRGGDSPGPWHESFFSCPDVVNDPAIENAIFMKEKQQ